MIISCKQKTFAASAIIRKTHLPLISQTADAAATGERENDKLKLKVGITEPSQNYGYHYEWYVDGLTNGDITKELGPGESKTGVLHIKPPAAPVDMGGYFTFWTEEVTISQNIFNRLVAFWIVK